MCSRSMLVTAAMMGEASGTSGRFRPPLPRDISICPTRALEPSIHTSADDDRGIEPARGEHSRDH